jgi:hypothetical protein
VPGLTVNAIDLSATTGPNTKATDTTVRIIMLIFGLIRDTRSTATTTVITVRKDITITIIVGLATTIFHRRGCCRRCCRLF